MSKYKIGDEVILTKIENAYGQNQSNRFKLPMVVRIRAYESSNSSYDYEVETLDGKGLSSVFEKNLQEISNIIERRQIEVIEHGISVKYMTNTKKDRVSVIINGNSVGRIPFERIDQLIVLLTTLQEQV